MTYLSLGLENAIIAACHNQIVTNEFMILSKLFELGAISKETFEQRVKSLGIDL